MKLFYRQAENTPGIIISHNISFNSLVRKLVEQTVVTNKDYWLHDTFSLMDTLNATSGNEKWTREELYRV